LNKPASERNLSPKPLGATKLERSRIKHHAPAVLWFTGLSGSGKSTIANIVERLLNERGMHTILLDGDSLRAGLNSDLGFDVASRSENVRRVAEVAKLMVDAGLIVICALISPFSAERALARRLFSDGEFIEVFVDTPLETCIERDPKGLYARALADEIRDFTGIHQPYEQPENPELILSTQGRSPEALAERVIEFVAAAVSGQPPVQALGAQVPLLKRPSLGADRRRRPL
jgi:adenylyl-sulfate kinase